jgi:hypothetical protein
VLQLWEGWHFAKECRLPRQTNSPRTPAPLANQ